MVGKFYISEADFRLMVKGELVRGREVIAPVQGKGCEPEGCEPKGCKPKGVSFVFEKIDKSSIESIKFNNFRIPTPLKYFFIRQREKVATYFKKPAITSKKKRLIIGAKGCDLRAIIYNDTVYLSPDIVDDNYKSLRDNTLIISSDCISLCDSCFCNLYNKKPYPEEGEDTYDLNLSPVNGGFVVSIGSEKGEGLYKRERKLFSEVNKRQLREMEKKRKAIENKINKLNSRFKFKDSFYNIVRKNFHSEVWKEFSATCVECNGCTNGCPTCYCFVLNDIKTDDGFARYKLHDACTYPGYARVAGGANPRPQLYQRFRHRYAHKFVYRKENSDIYDCVGCGRCIESCQGEISLKENLWSLQKL